jgi:hypothetical protein
VARHAAALGGYAILAAALTYPVVPRLTSHVPIAHQIPGWMPGDGDPWQSLWGLWFVTRSLLTEGRLPLHTDALFYPLGVDFSFVVLVLLPLLLAVPLVALLGPVIAYNAMVVGALALAGYAAFLLAARVVGHRGAAFVAGAVFAFSPYQMVHATEHLFLIVGAIWVPLYALFLLRTLDGGGLGNAALAAIWMACAAFSSPYYAIFLGLFTVMLAGDRLWRAGGLGPRVVVARRLLTVAVLALLPVVPAAAFLLRRWSADSALATPLADVNTWSADLVAFVVPSPMHPLWGRFVEPVYRRFTGNLFEQTVYVGIPVLILAGVAVVTARRKIGVWAVSALVFFGLALGPFLHVLGSDTFSMWGHAASIPLPGLLLYQIPVLSSIRVASRFDCLVMLCLAVLAAQGVAWLAARLAARPGGTGRGRMPVALATAAVVVDFASAPLPILDARTPAAYAALGRAGRPVGSLVDIPLDWRIARYQYLQTAHHQRLITGFLPRPTHALVHQADLVPFVPLFVDPRLIVERRPRHGDSEDALRFVDLFDVNALAIHRHYLPADVAGRLREFVAATFPVERIIDDGGLVVFPLRRTHDSAALWRRPGAYRLDFGPGGGGFFIAKGWFPPEMSGDVGFAWSAGRESTLAFYLPRAWPLILELSVLPFRAPSLPPQGMEVHVNGQRAGELALEEGWRTYRLALPALALRTGINTIRFIYRVAATPAGTVPGSEDPRVLAVAFDRLELLPANP